MGLEAARSEGVSGTDLNLVLWRVRVWERRVSEGLS